jgi:hypothetical protein
MIDPIKHATSASRTYIQLIISRGEALAPTSQRMLCKAAMQYVAANNHLSRTAATMFKGLAQSDKATRRHTSIERSLQPSRAITVTTAGS